MKFRLVFIVVVIMSLVLTACGGGGGSGDATKPVKDFFDAFADLDAEKASEAVCQQYREDIKGTLEMFAGLMALAGEDAKIEVVDLKLEVQEESGDEAMVVATGGKLRFTAMGETEEQDLAGDADMGAVKVIKEDGKWVICDDAMAEGLAP